MDACNLVKQSNNYQMLSMALTRPSSEGDTNASCVRARFCLVVFFVRICLLKACLRLIRPDPVNLKRFLALDLVFTLGMMLVLSGYKCYFLGTALGDSIRNILLPSSLGISSTLATSSRPWANFSSRISPRSLNTIVLPAK